MKKAGLGGRPRYYQSETITTVSAKNQSDQVLILGDYLELVDSPDGGTLSFIPAGDARVVSLTIKRAVNPGEAIREWSIRQKAQEKRVTVETSDIDINEAAKEWNKGPEPHLVKAPCQHLHLGGTRGAFWGPEIQRAIDIWNAHNCVGAYPPEVLAYLDPNQRAPFITDSAPPPLPSEKRLLFAAIDIALPLEEQFQALQKKCTEIRQAAFQLANQPIPRPGRREDSRDVLIYTLRRSARWSVPNIAKSEFPKQDLESAETRVKDIVRKVERALRAGGFKGLPQEPAEPK